MKIAYIQVDLICPEVLIGWCILMYDGHTQECSADYHQGN